MTDFSPALGNDKLTNRARLGKAHIKVSVAELSSTFFWNAMSETTVIRVHDMVNNCYRRLMWTSTIVI